MRGAGGFALLFSLVTTLSSAAAAPVSSTGDAATVVGAIAPSQTTAAPPASSPAAPASIPIPEVATRAEDVNRQLRDADTLAVPGPVIFTVERRLPEITKHITQQAEETNRQLDEEPAPATLEALGAQWDSVRAELAGYVVVLAARATALERALENLMALRETWTRTRTDAPGSRAPAQVLDRIDGVLAAVAATRSRLQEQRAATLVLQDRVAHEVARCDEVLRSIASARDSAQSRLLVRDSMSLWNAHEREQVLTELPQRVRNAVDLDISLMRRFADGHRWRLPLQIVFFTALFLVVLVARRRLHALRPPGDTTPTPLDRPVSAALLLTLVLSVFFVPIPRVAQTVGQVVLLVPALRIAGPTLSPRRARELYVLGALLLIDLVRRFASVVPLLEQPIFLVEMLAGVLALGWRLRESTMRLVAGVTLAAFAGAAVAASAGYVRLGLLVGSGILGCGYLALVLHASVVIADALVFVALRIHPLRALRLMERHRRMLERRARRWLRWFAYGAGLVFALRFFGVWKAAVALTDAALEAELRRGSVTLSLGSVLVFVVTVAAAFALSAIVRFVLEEEVYPRLAPQRVLPYALSTLIHYALVLTGFLLALAVLSVDLTKVTILAGAFGVGVGFGLQNLVNNFVSGLVVLYERRINVGDAIQVGDVAGQVQQMSLRACTVRTWEGAEVIVPNATLTSEKVTNWTLSDRLRRIDLAVGVAYGTSPEKVAEVLLGVARSNKHVLPDPEPIVLFLGFGDSSLRFEMRAWTANFDRWLQTRSELTATGYAALSAAGIAIPIPQREVLVRRA